MATKTGGGNLQQEYDPATGRYGYPCVDSFHCRSEIEGPYLTVTQHNAIIKARNAIKYHLRESEYEALNIELHGGLIKNKDGTKIWDHVTEVKEGLSSLRKSINSLKKSRQNPYLHPKISKYFGRLISKHEKVMKRFEALFEEVE